MTSALIIVTLAIVAHSLWIRRHTWRSHWEVGATVAIALLGCSLVLMSPWASATIGPWLHHFTRLWNAPAMLGHLCLAFAIPSIVYHVLVRLADDSQVRELFRAYIVVPVRLGVLLLAAAFVIAHDGHYPDLFAARIHGTWLAIHWVVGGCLMLYMSGYACRALLILRDDPRATATVNLYLVSAGFGMAASTTQMSIVWTHVNVTTAVWMCSCLAVAIFAYASTRSWQAKLAWFVPDDRPPPQPQPSA